MYYIVNHKLVCHVSRGHLLLILKKHAYSNAKTEDLWAALEEGSGEPVNKLMNSWTQQKGYPVVSVEVKDQNLKFEQVSFWNIAFRLLDWIYSMVLREQRS